MRSLHLATAYLYAIKSNNVLLFGILSDPSCLAGLEALFPIPNLHSLLHSAPTTGTVVQWASFVSCNSPLDR